MNNNKIILWGSETPRALRPAWALAELNIEHQHICFGPRSSRNNTDEFIALSRKQKIPLLQHGEVTITESAAITQYLFNLFGENHEHIYIPGTPRDKAVLDEWTFFAMTELDAHALYIIRRHEGLAATYGAAPNVVESAKAYFDRLITAAVPNIRKVPNYLFGDHLSSADIILTTTLVWAKSIGLPLPDEFEVYRQRLIGRPAYQRAFSATMSAIQSPIMN